MSSGGRAIGNSDRDRKPKLLAITRAVLENRVQTPVDDRGVLARATIKSPPALTDYVSSL